MIKNRALAKLSVMYLIDSTKKIYRIMRFFIMFLFDKGNPDCYNNLACVQKSAAFVSVFL